MRAAVILPRDLRLQFANYALNDIIQDNNGYIIALKFRPR
jgi:hypothetical protein